jgi:hypothetical protein
MCVLVLMVALLAVGASACGGSPHRAPPASRTPTPQPTPQPEAAPSGHAGVAWTYDALMRRLHGRRLPVGGRTVRIDRATLACGGVGRPARRVDGEPAWTRFRCVQPTFPPGAVAGPDAIFIVEPTGPHKLAIGARRLTRY